jgi:hypothetical protein
MSRTPAPAHRPRRALCAVPPPLRRGVAPCLRRAPWRRAGPLPPDDVRAFEERLNGTVDSAATRSSTLRQRLPCSAAPPVHSSLPVLEAYRSMPQVGKRRVSRGIGCVQPEGQGFQLGRELGAMCVCLCSLPPRASRAGRSLCSSRDTWAKLKRRSSSRSSLCAAEDSDNLRIADSSAPRLEPVR